MASRGCALLAALALSGGLATPRAGATAPTGIYTYTATLSGPAVSPPNASPGTGSAVVTYYSATHTLGVGVTFSGLTGTTTASHIQGPTAIAGTGNAGVITTTPTFSGFPLGVTSGSYTNTLDLTQATSYSSGFISGNGGTTASAESALVAALAAGKAYYDIHTTTFPGGEIREFLSGPSGNFPPTGIVLSSNSVAENQSSGASVGSFTANDPNASDTFTYALVAGTGDTGNSSFSITGGSNLVTAAILDYETQNSYSIRVAVTDNGGMSYTNTFTINVTDVNEAPTGLALSNNSVAENQSSGTQVGHFIPTDASSVDTFTYAFVAGTGDTDNGSFSLSDSNLLTAASFDYETKSSYSIRVAVTDGGGSSFTNTFTITVTDVNETPTDLSLSPSSVAENSVVGTLVGNFTPTDPDSGNTFTYAFATGTGDTDNGSFTINGHCLKTAASFNYEVKNSYSIRVSVYDGANTFEKQLTVSVTDVNEQPTVLALSPQSVFENKPTGTTVGTFSTTDEDNSHGDTHTYYFDTGPGDTDNASFSIAGSALKTGAAFDYETKNSYSIRVRSVDSGSLSITNTFTISILDTNEAPTDITLSTNMLTEQQIIGTVVGALTTTDEDIVHGDTHTYSLVYHDGCEDNAYFGISGTNLVTASNLLYSARSTYHIVIRTTDSGGLYYDEDFTIYILPLPGTPPAPVFTNTFALDANGWTRFPGLTLTLDGSGHGQVAAGTPAAPTAAATDFGAYESGLASGSGFTTSLDIQLDTNTAEGLKFGYLVAINNAAHQPTNEFAFLLMRTNVGGACGFLINTGVGLPGSFENPDGSADAPGLSGAIVLTNSGWYTFQHWFHPDASTNLVAELTLLDANTNIVASWTITTALKVPADAYGSRYGKIFGNEFNSLLVDNSSLTTIPRPVALATAAVVNEDESVPVRLGGYAYPASVPIKYKVTVAPTHGILSVTTGSPFTNPTVTYTPSADYFGTDSFKYVVSNGAQDSLAVTVSLTVMSVNDAPSFALSVSSVTVAEDSAQTTMTIVNSASVSKGPANESGQLISYLIDPGYNTALFMTQPTVSSIGSLTFRPAPNASGNTTINVRAMDNGGTACGGHDTSGALPFLISITPSNDAPVLAVITNLTVSEGLTSTPTADVPLTITDIETPLASMSVSVVLSNQTGGIVLPASVGTNYSGGVWHVLLPVVAEQSGQVNVHVTATDTGDGPSPARSASRMFVFKVLAVNDAPGFVIPASVHSAPNVLVTTAAFSTFYANGATPSDTSENAQTGSYTLTVQTADRAKFATLPTITSAGTLTYKFATGASGSCVVQVKVTDNGGTAGGGVNVSPTQNLTFIVDP